MTIGVPAKQLSDDDLRRELLSLKTKQDEILSAGTPAQQANHRARTAELEDEFVARFAHPSDQDPDLSPNPSDAGT
ncbi:MAG: hypothetical protein JWO63_1116, partial [Frankiales bacterium]|nr:hypothetical protein [Frankiales bacterium]